MLHVPLTSPMSIGESRSIIERDLQLVRADVSVGLRDGSEMPRYGKYHQLHGTIEPM